MRNNYDFGSLLMLFFLFSIGTSIIGGVISLLTLTLGFPYTWTGGLSLLILGLCAFLYFRRYSILGWLLAGCLLFIGIALMALARGFLSQRPAMPEPIWNALENSEFTSVMGFGTVAYDENYLYDDFGNMIYVIDAEDNAPFLVYDYMPRTSLLIYFPPLETQNGDWMFEAGEISIEGEQRRTFPADPRLNWLSNDLSTSGNPQIIDPFLRVDIPFSPRQTDQAIPVEATLTLRYPLDGAIQTQTLTRSFEAYLASEQFYNHQLAYTNWRQARNVVENPLALIGLIGGSIGAAVFAGVLVQRGALEQQASGDALLVIRRVSGLKRLGIEAHTLSKMQAPMPVHEGVLIGLVMAQSPAGRSGLRSGDILTRFNNKDVTTPRQLNRLLSSIKRGQSATATIIRQGEPLELTIRF